LANFGMFEFHKAGDMIALGEAAAERELHHILEYVAHRAA